jgi:hypothetical protein
MESVTEMESNAKFKDLDITAVGLTSVMDLYILRLTPSFLLDAFTLRVSGA